VSEVQGEGNIVVKQSVVRFLLLCECQWMADSTDIVTVWTACLGSCSHLLRSVCGTSTLSAECSTPVVLLHSDVGTLCIQNWVRFFLFYCEI
jgi:hypothetical protein